MLVRVDVEPGVEGLGLLLHRRSVLGQMGLQRVEPSVALGRGHDHVREGSLTQARPTQASLDRLVEGSGHVPVELTGADFEFVEKVEIEKDGKRRAPPLTILIRYLLGAVKGRESLMPNDECPKNDQARMTNGDCPDESGSSIT